ncbi:MAG: hypothetical protein HZA31_01030 [Opitutae bacterium]|nr:hypothetical protein [Opitutae bacterium]
MNSRLLSLASSFPLLLLGLHAQSSDKAPEPPPPVMQAPAAPEMPPRAENQRVYGPSSATVVPADQARALVEKFSAAYGKLGNPRLLVYVNRELVDTTSGLKLTGRTERYERTKTDAKRQMERADAPAAPATAGTPQTQVTVNVGGASGGERMHGPRGSGTASTDKVTTSGQNTYTIQEAAKPTLADRQTVREVERLFGRAFRAAGATLTDQRVAADMIGDKSLADLAGTSDQAAKDRAALGQVADVVLEILISSRNLTVPAVSGDQTLTVPDIQATAIRLKDAVILGQAAASDVLGKDAQASRIARTFDVRDITEATALALMEDMLTSAK